MKQGYGLVKASVAVFQVLAWVSLVVQVVVGLILLVSGGPAVPIGGIDVPSRVVGALNCVAGGIYWFLMSVTSQVLRLLLDVHARGEKGGV